MYFLGLDAIPVPNHSVRHLIVSGFATVNKNGGNSNSNSGFFGTMRTEMFRGRDWAGAALDELGRRTDANMERRNATGVKRSPGSMGPLQYRRSLGLAA